MLKTEKIKIIIGLGNPGEEYSNTPHNIGKNFINWFFDFIVENKLGSKTLKWKKNKSVMGDVASLEIGGVKLILAIPTGFMNLSGLTALKLINFYGVDPKQVIVVHDDTDLVAGNFKITYGCSSAGHKGIESTISNLKTQSFWRLKIGVRPDNLNQSLYRIKAGDFVIKKMSIKNKKIIENRFDDIYVELSKWIKDN